jgi:hypothetical protein
LPDIVHELGAAAGLGGVVGLAALSALHVSQARDVRRLRAWAGREPERAAPVISPPRRSQPWYSRIGTRHVAVALVALLVLGGAAAYGVTQLTGGSPNKPKPHGAPIKPGTVTVAVLNGTTVPGLAAKLRDQIAAAGFQKGPINVFSDQQLAESVVEYAPGREAEARLVGRRVGISQRAPVTANSRDLAGDATVIVIAGADKAP